MQTRAQASSEQPGTIRLICLACNRQQLEQYRLWANALNEPAELIAVDLCAAAAWPDCAELARTLAEQLAPYLAQPHALYGQGQGAEGVLALTKLTQRTWPGQTRHLFVAGCDSPERVTGNSEALIHVPMTVLYPPGALPAMLGWNRLANRGLELIELPACSTDARLSDQRIVRIFNTHLGLLSF